MKITMKLLVLIFGVLLLANVAHAESPREQLKQMVEQLQQAPNDNALREKIIKLAQTIKPAPAVPEEAERRMARGTAAFKGAKSVADYRDAAKEFEQATLVAPWYGDAYFNLGVAQDKAENYEAALHSLKLAQLASPEVKEIKALIYEVEYRNEKINSPEAQAARRAEIQQKKDTELKKNLDGAVFIKRKTFDYGTGEWEIRISFEEVTYSYEVIEFASDSTVPAGMNGTWRQILMNSGYSGTKMLMASGRLEGKRSTLTRRVARDLVEGDSMNCEVLNEGASVSCSGELIGGETWIFERR